MKPLSLLVLFIVAMRVVRPATAQPPLYAFVGSFVQIEEVECGGEEIDPNTGETLIVLCGDSLFRTTYRVEQVLEGNLEVGEIVTFHAADHYGFPDFAEQKTALLFLVGEKDDLSHIKYTWEHAYPTADNRFAECGCKFESDLGEDSCVDVVFAPPVTVDLSHASSAIVSDLDQNPDYRVIGDTATCVRGHFVESFYDLILDEAANYYRE